MEIKIHKCSEILPDMEVMTNRVAFIWDGCIVSGWPLDLDGDDSIWEANGDVGRGGVFSGVTHWVEFPVTLTEIEHGERN